MWMYRFEAVGTVGGEPVPVIVDADVLPPNVTEVRVVEKVFRKKPILDFEFDIATDSVLFLGEERKTIRVMFTVTGRGRGWERVNSGIILRRDDPPTNKYSVRMPWRENLPIDNAELHFHPDETDDYTLLDEDGYED